MRLGIKDKKYFVEEMFYSESIRTEVVPQSIFFFFFDTAETLACCTS